MLIQIKNWKTDEVIFELDKENNSCKDTVEEAVRQGVDLSFANLFGFNLFGIDLRGANLNQAILQFSILEGADLRGANLSNANLSNANLIGADLTGAKIENTFFYRTYFGNTTKIDLPMICPETGSFIGYKKLFNTKEYDGRDFIVKLEIPEDAKRSSSTTNKCRCSKAKVLEIKDVDSDEMIDEITNVNVIQCTYKVGEYVYPDRFDECRWNECSHGIHFFMTEKEALAYSLAFH